MDSSSPSLTHQEANLSPSPSSGSPVLLPPTHPVPQSSASACAGDDDIYRPTVDVSDLMTENSPNNSDNEAETPSSAPSCFEGPEKNLEVLFCPSQGPARGCREFTRTQLDAICKAARCTILNFISNEHVDAYLLSESSLFVFPHKMVLKTCGTTTLLRCLPTLITYATDLGMKLEYVQYSRKNYTFPGDQIFPHSNFHEELAFMKSHTKLSQRLDGSGYILGPITGDHWYCYIADQIRRPVHVTKERTINIMMFDLAPQVAALFFQKNMPENVKSEEYAQYMTTATGIRGLCPSAHIDDFSFEPCGYSMNAIEGNNYHTIHVTPEELGSYASYETSTVMSSYASVINNVLNVFKPKRFVVTMFADEAGLGEITESPFEVARLTVPQFGATYGRTSVSSTKVEGDVCCFMANYVELPSVCPPASAASAAATPSATAVSDVDAGEERQLRRNRGYSITQNE